MINKLYEKPQILFRYDTNCFEEFKTSCKHFPVVSNRSACKENSMVIGRYSVLPYYYELSSDLSFNHSYLINPISSHNWIADFTYYNWVKDFTFESWTEDNFYKCQHNGPFVVKGQTNSRKHQWKQKMFAENKRQAIEIASDLKQDGLISSQKIIFRKYVPLKTYEIGLNDLPFTNEWRFFCLKDKIVSCGYYWTEAEYADKYNSQIINSDMYAFVKQIMEIVHKFVNFYVLDIAETEDGNYILVEINDGQMSGLSMINPDIFYINLYSTVKEEWDYLTYTLCK